MSISCSICHENINFHDEEVSVLRCGHLFHQRCLQQWLDKSMSCPQCRSKVKEKNVVKKIHPSFTNEYSDLLAYKGSSDETKSILEDCDSLKNKFIKRVVTLESRNSKLTEDLRKSEEENTGLRQRLEREIKSLEERFESDLDKLRKENQLLTTENSSLKCASKNSEKLKLENKTMKKKLSSIISLIQNESSSNDESTDESISSNGPNLSNESTTKEEELQSTGWSIVYKLIISITLVCSNFLFIYLQ